jgi:hypothetical protein
MIAATTSSAAPATRDDGRLGVPLGEMHRQWLKELRANVERATAKDRDIWRRWEAIRYVDTVFSGRFDRERSAINRLTESAPLWVSGELVSNLRLQLRNSVGLCHHATEFSTLTDKLVRAVEYWFAMVEDVMGPIKLADLSREARQELAALGIETAPSWSDLPASLATSL